MWLKLIKIDEMVLIYIIKTSFTTFLQLLQQGFVVSFLMRTHLEIVQDLWS